MARQSVSRAIFANAVLNSATDIVVPPTFSPRPAGFRINGSNARTVVPAAFGCFMAVVGFVANRAIAMRPSKIQTPGTLPQVTGTRACATHPAEAP
jgi:hypothetical protein